MRWQWSCHWSSLFPCLEMNTSIIPAGINHLRRYIYLVFLKTSDCRGSIMFDAEDSAHVYNHDADLYGSLGEKNTTI
jgi:hypothetical protein